ncbi:hypothetical protein OBBRIDRAFT_236815 [Obba rivulosa]|uniref:Uncharacterized protein n=1 Tax=Obba rivulosa TaxID=1052685 RepID=A0A8E2DV53_9APHY|nr:hypothetical protein OBBRIDRAFT_236815 [Obba rivulosa]
MPVNISTAHPQEFQLSGFAPMVLSVRRVRHGNPELRFSLCFGERPSVIHKHKSRLFCAKNIFPKCALSGKAGALNSVAVRHAACHLHLFQTLWWSRPRCLFLEHKLYFTRFSEDATPAMRERNCQSRSAVSVMTRSLIEIALRYDDDCAGEMSRIGDIPTNRPRLSVLSSVPEDQCL